MKMELEVSSHVRTQYNTLIDLLEDKIDTGYEGHCDYEMLAIEILGRLQVAPLEQIALLKQELLAKRKAAEITSQKNHEEWLSKQTPEYREMMQKLNESMRINSEMITHNIINTMFKTPTIYSKLVPDED